MVSVLILDSQKYSDNQIYPHHYCNTTTPPISPKQHIVKSDLCHPIVVKDTNEEADLGCSIQPLLNLVLCTLMI